jgi:DNA repair protein SbcC/Rad50
VNPISARASGYRSYQEIAIDFPSGVTAVVGENGSGKSSLIELIPLALFGSPTRSLADYLNTECEEMSIELTFEHAGRLLRVRRQFSSRGRGKSTLDLEEANLGPPFGPLIEGDWSPLTRETAAVTQAHLEEILGLARETYLASAHLSQGQGDAFTAAQPRDRKEILAQILGLGIWDRLQKVARDELRGCETEIAVSAGQIAGLEEQVARMGDVLEMLAALREAQTIAVASLAAAESDLADAQRAHAAAATLAETVRVCQAELAAATTAHERAVQAFSDATRAAHDLTDRAVELDEVTADAAQVAVLEARVEQLRAAAADAVRLVGERDQLLRDAEQRDLALSRMAAQALQLYEDAKTMRGKADHLEAHIDEAGECDRCHQKLGAEAAARAAASYRAEADTLVEKAKPFQEAGGAEEAAIAALRTRAEAIEVPQVEDPGPVEYALRVARAAAVRQAALTAQVEQLTAAASRIGEFEAAASASLLAVAERQTTLDKAQADIPDLTALDSRVGLAQISVRDARATVETRQAEIVRAETDLERITEAEQKLTALQSDLHQVNERIDLLKIAERAYGRDGIPALILESSAIPQIETEANRLLAELGTTYRVELRTQAENKTNANLRETLDVLVYDGTDIRAYETFSGGEKTRINLALRLALAGLLATRRGAQSSILCIDEPDGLDQAGMDALATVLLGLSGTFERVLVVSHQPQLGTSFDQTLRVEKGEDGRSRIVGALEAVPA